jgi:hypothetical protein
MSEQVKRPNAWREMMMMMIMIFVSPACSITLAILHDKVCGPGSSVGIATGYGAGRSGDRIPVGVRFFTHVQTGPRARPASCTMGTGSFPGVKRPGRGADHPPPSSAEVMKG